MSAVTLRQAADFLLRNDRYTILTHRRPDGDTVGSAIALCLGLRSLGKTASILQNPQFTPRYLPYLEGLTAEAVDSCVISVDIASESLFPKTYSGAVRLGIDHHGSNSGYAAEGFTDGSRGACGELIWELLGLLGVTVTPQIADALYFAITTDTGCFRYSNTTPETLRIAASLIECGADAVTLNRKLFEVKSRARFRLEAYLTQGLRTYGGGKIGICVLPEEKMREMGVNEDDADAIAGFARDLEGVEIGVLLRDLPGNQCKLSLRTDDRRCDASRVCMLLGGGGHSAAAGATVPGSIEDGRAAVLGAIAAVTGLDTREDT